MATEYISREAALSMPWANGQYDHEHANEHFICGLETYKEWLEQIPAADVKPVVRGKWKHDGSDWKNRFICDQCGYKWFFEAEEAHFCSNCGCAMGNEISEEREKVYEQERINRMLNEVREQIDILFKRVCILEERLSPPEKVVEKVIE